MISKRAFKVLLVALAPLFLSPARILATPPSECSANDLLALLRPDDPAYSDAMELSQFLKTRGFTVKCVGQSKSINLFTGQSGAAVYRTDHGDFDVLFLPKSEAFAVQPIERRQNGRYLYTFGGNPRASGGPWDSAHPIYFVQFANQLFVANDSRVPENLQKALHPQ